MDPRLLLIPTAVFVLTLLAHLAALKLFPKLGLLDFPQRYGLQRPRIPYPTGILAVGMFLIAFALTFRLDMQQAGVIIAVLLLATVSFIDDRTPLPFWVRLSVQIVAAALVFAAGSRIYTVTNPLGGIIKLDSLTVAVPVFGSLPVLSGVFTVGWLLLTVNALNWFDGVPGQVSLLSGIGFLLLGFLAVFRNDQPEIAMLSFILAAIALACVLFDFPPAKVLMGDSGSMFFGFMLGLIGVYQGGKVATAFLALGIPLIDAAFVVIRRMLRGNSPFKGDRDHLHHRLLAKGLSQRAIVLLMAGVSGILGLTALFLDTGGKAVQGAMLIVIVSVMTKWTKRKVPRSQSLRTG